MVRKCKTNLVFCRLNLFNRIGSRGLELKLTGGPLKKEIMLRGPQFGRKKALRAAINWIRQCKPSFRQNMALFYFNLKQYLSNYFYTKSLSGTHNSKTNLDIDIEFGLNNTLCKP